MKFLNEAVSGVQLFYGTILNFKFIKVFCKNLIKQVNFYHFTIYIIL